MRIIHGLLALGVVTASMGKSSGDEPKTPAAAAAAVEALPEGKVVFLQSPVEKRIREALERPVKFEAAACLELEKFVALLEEKFGIPAAPDWPSLTADGKAELNFNFTGRSGRLRPMLRSILEPEGLDYVVQDDELLVTTKPTAQITTTLRVYQVHDLVAMPNDPGAAYPDYDALAGHVSHVVDYSGGTPSYIEPFDGPGLMVLVVAQTEEGHARIEQLLQRLRLARCQELKTLQVTDKLEPAGRYVWSGAQFMPESPHPLRRPPATPLPTGKSIDLAGEAERRIAEALEQPAKIDAAEMTVEKLSEQLRERHALPVLIDLPALTADGRGIETILRARSDEGTLRNALNQVLRPTALVAVVRNESLLLTTRTAAETYTYSNVYQVQDLVMPSESASGVNDEIVKLHRVIIETIALDTWRDGNGTQFDPGIVVGPGIAALRIEQTEEVHREVERLLETLRAAKNPKVYEYQRHRPDPPPGAIQGGGFF